MIGGNALGAMLWSKDDADWAEHRPSSHPQSLPFYLLYKVSGQDMFEDSGKVSAAKV